MSRPEFCPNCGAALGGENAAVRIFDDRSGDGGYDCSCQTCGWSGDIFPDEQGRFGGGNGGEPPEPRGEQGP